MIVATVAVTTRTETDRRLGGLERRPQNKITFSFPRGGCNEARAAWMRHSQSNRRLQHHAATKQAFFLQENISQGLSYRREGWAVYP